jgi:hypothetical protein
MASSTFWSWQAPQAFLGLVIVAGAMDPEPASYHQKKKVALEKKAPCKKKLR